MKIKQILLGTITACIGLLTSCKEIDIAQKDHPFIVMKNVQVSESGAEFQANVKSIGIYKVLSYGFVWSTEASNRLGVVQFQKKIFSTLSLGDISMEVNSGLAAGQTYFVRPFVKIEKITVYGSGLSFISKGSNPPVIHDFEPKEGSVGTHVEITGLNFGVSKNANIVRFGQHTAIIDSAIETKLYVRVPLIKQDGKLNISVETADMMSKHNETFNYYYPWTKLNMSHYISYKSTHFVVGESAYIIREHNTNGLKFNSSNKTLTSFTLPENSGEHPQVFTDSNKAYVLLEKGFYEYEVTTNLWTKKADIFTEYHDYAKFNRMRNFTMSFDKVGFLGSVNNYKEKKMKIWSYNIETNTWKELEGIPEVMHTQGVFSFTKGSKGYIGLSHSLSSGNISFREYDFISNYWTEKKPMPSKSYSSYACMVINENIYVGLGSGQDSNKLWRYDQPNDGWISYQNCPIGIPVTTSFGIVNKGYMLSLNYPEEIWEFDPSKN